MQVNLKVRQLIFGDRGLCFMVQSLLDQKYSYHGVTELFTSDNLLSQFNFADIRLICYFAVVNEFESDHLFLKKVKRSKNFRKKVWAGTQIKI